MEPFVVGIRFQKVGKVYHFDAGDFRDIKIGDFAVVDTSRGSQLGEVVAIIEEPTPPNGGGLKPIVRPATPSDLVIRQLWMRKETEAMVNCRAKVVELGYTDVKIVAAEFSFDGDRLSFLYSSETEEKVDFKKLRTAMKRLYNRARIDMRQVGPRDVAKHLGGMGACGLESRCCSMFITDFSPISIKMAKEQGISLTPSEITGMCGRLRCCLVYEYEQYVEAKKQLPKRGKRVRTPTGEGRVIDIYPFKVSVVVELDKGGQQEFALESIEPWEEAEALKKKTTESCDKPGNVDCEFRKNR